MESRPTCYRCRKVQSLCYCDKLKALPVATEFVILRHLHERSKAIGTAELARAGLAQAKILDGVEYEASTLESFINDPARSCMVLFPGKTAHNLSLQKLALAPPKHLTVFVLDGTWSCARKLLTANPVLAQLPRLSFEVTSLDRSRYRIRRQPHGYCLSTVEAVCKVLELQEGEASLEARTQLLAAFEDMVSRQEAFSSPVCEESSPEGKSP